MSLVKTKTEEEIQKMRIAGRLAADVLEMIEPFVKVGISTFELDEICHNYIVNEQGAYPSPLNYHGFPKSICTSINDVVCHGIPNRDQILCEGDIMNIDITVTKDGYLGDTSKMFLIGDVSPQNKRLCKVAQDSLYEAIKKIKPGIKLCEIGNTIQKVVKSSNTRFSIVKEFCGHGIGSEFHEAPQVLHYANNDQLILQEGFCFTIEPMINIGKYKTYIDEQDGWTAYTIDHKNSAQWEHTILVTKNGYEVLTLRSEETFPKSYP